MEGATNSSLAVNPDIAWKILGAIVVFIMQVCRDEYVVMSMSCKVYFTCALSRFVIETCYCVVYVYVACV